MEMPPPPKKKKCKKNGKISNKQKKKGKKIKRFLYISMLSFFSTMCGRFHQHEASPAGAVEACVLQMYRKVTHLWLSHVIKSDMEGTEA